MGLDIFNQVSVDRIEEQIRSLQGVRHSNTRRSDHSPFWDRGFKAVMVTDTANFRNPHDHQPTAKLETLNLSFAAQVCRVVMSVILDLGKMKL